MNNLAFLCTDGGVACDAFWVILPMQLLVSVLFPTIVIYSFYRWRALLFRSVFRTSLLIAFLCALATFWVAVDAPTSIPPELTIFVILPLMAVAGLGAYFYRDYRFVVRHITKDELAVASLIGIVATVATAANILLILIYVFNITFTLKFKK